MNKVLLALGAAGAVGALVMMKRQSRKYTAEGFLQTVAQGSRSEVEIGRLASVRGGSEDVRRYGERLVNDHSRINEELRQLAGRKGVSLPQEIGWMKRMTKEKLSKLEGRKFDREFIKGMVKDHEKDVRMFEEHADYGSDADVREFAARTAPTLREHLRIAQEIARREDISTTAQEVMGKAAGAA